MEPTCWECKPRTCSVLYKPSAAGNNSTPNTVPVLPPSPCSVFSEDWDWLDTVTYTPDLEQLEELANSLFAQAVECEEFENRNTSMVGTKTESMESIRNSQEETFFSYGISIEETKPAVTYPVRCSDDMVLTAVVTKNSDLIYIEDAVEEVTCLSDDCVIKEEVILSPDIVDSVTSNELYEEVSDNGYESVDSPLSEPDHLTYLFPELW